MTRRVLLLPTVLAALFVAPLQAAPQYCVDVCPPEGGGGHIPCVCGASGIVVNCDSLEACFICVAPSPDPILASIAPEFDFSAILTGIRGFLRA